MLNALVTSFTASLRIGLSKNGIAMIRLSGWRHRQHQVLFDDTLTNEETLTPKRIALSLESLIDEANCAGLPTEVILDDEWVRFFIVTPPKGCSRIEDSRAAANMRFQFLYGDGLVDWHIESAWDPQHPFLACALPQSLHAELLNLATKHRLTLISVLPNFIATWNRWHRQLQSTGWFGVVYGKQLTLGIVDQHRLCAVRTLLLPDDVWDDPEWLPDCILREALRLNVSVATSLQLCGEIPVQWTSKTIGSLECIRLDADSQAFIKAGQSASLILANVGLYQ